MVESGPRSCVQASLRLVCTLDLGQDSSIQNLCSVNNSLTELYFSHPLSTSTCSTHSHVTQPGFEGLLQGIF